MEICTCWDNNMGEACTECRCVSVVLNCLTFNHKLKSSNLLRHVFGEARTRSSQITRVVFHWYYHYTPAQRSWGSGGIYWIHLVRPSVCRRHGFWSGVTELSFGISISNFICMLLVLYRSLLIFSDVTFKMAVWQSYWIFRFPYSNFSLAFNI